MTVSGDEPWENIVEVATFLYNKIKGNDMRLVVVYSTNEVFRLCIDQIISEIYIIILYGSF